MKMGEVGGKKIGCTVSLLVSNHSPPPGPTLLVVVVVVVLAEILCFVWFQSTVCFYLDVS